MLTMNKVIANSEEDSSYVIASEAKQSHIINCHCEEGNYICHCEERSDVAILLRITG